MTPTFMGRKPGDPNDTKEKWSTEQNSLNEKGREQRGLLQR